LTADTVISLGARWAVIDGDNAAVLPSIPDCSVDAIVTDPPAGIAFMGKDWDHHKGGRDAWIAWLRGVMAECLRVLKPGGHALIWAIPRTSHWTMTAVEDAGFEIRDCVYHAFGQGFPKSLSVSKAIEAHVVTGGKSSPRDIADARDASGQGLPSDGESHAFKASGDESKQGVYRNAPGARWDPTTPEAAQWEGWGTALKPAVEPWILARKPLDGTVAANVLKHGTGAINIDGCRVGTEARFNGPARAAPGTFNASPGSGDGYTGATVTGRFPAHLTLSHNPDCREVGTRKVATGTTYEPTGDRSPDRVAVSSTKMLGRTVGYADADGMETISAWECSEGCAVAMLDAQSGESCPSGGAIRAAMGYGGSAGQGSVRPVRKDSGGASRFFYTAKASRSDREEGLAGMPTGQRDETRDPEAPGANNPRNRGGQARANIHPTVKPTDLMRWLVRLITPPGGIVLDPFTGSGSTGKAAALEGMRFIGVEREAEYAAIARARIAHAYEHGTKLARKQPLAKGVAFAPATISDPAAE